jgi:predicted membrane-bound mannosyltransferase
MAHFVGVSTSDVWHLRHQNGNADFASIFCTLRRMQRTLTAASGSIGRTPRTLARGTISARPAQIVTAALVLVLTVLGLWIRLYGLQGWDGTLTVDEARLAMAARGVVETGLPKLPSGWVYTRGLLATYLTAPSLMLVGASDFAVRLPAGLAGAALIPVAFALGREVAGRVGGLFVAALLMGHPSFVVWSRQAWFYAL